MRSLATSNEVIKPYPAFVQAIREVTEDIEALTREGEMLCQKEVSTLQDPERKEVVANFVDFLRNVRQYWHLSVKSAEMLPIRTPSWLTLIADPKEFFRKDKEVDDFSNFTSVHDKERNVKRKRMLIEFSRGFANYCKIRGIPLPKLERADQSTIDRYIKALVRYIKDERTSLLVEDDENSLIDLIQEVSKELLGNELGALTSSHIRRVLTPKVSSLYGFSRFAKEDDWSEWKEKAQKISNKITEKLIPLYRSLNDAWMPKVNLNKEGKPILDADAPDPYSKNRKMLRNFFVGEKGSGLGFYGRDVLIPNVNMYIQSIYGKEGTLEQQQVNYTLEQKTKIIHAKTVLQDLIKEKSNNIINDIEEAREGLESKIKEVTDESDKKKLQDVIKEVKVIGNETYQKLEQLGELGLSDEQRNEMTNKAAQETVNKLKNVGNEIDILIDKESQKQQGVAAKKMKDEQAILSFRSLSVYAREDAVPTWFKPFISVIQQVKQITDKVKQWIGKKEIKKETTTTKEDVKKKLTEVYQEYVQKIADGVKVQVEELKRAADASSGTFFDAFLKELPEALNKQLFKYHEYPELLLSGNKTVQEHFKQDAERIIQELFAKYITEPIEKMAIGMFRNRLCLGTDLTLEDKDLKQRVQKDVFKLDKNVLDKVLVDSFKATIDKNKEEVESLVSSSEK